jgi:hypothetical protein
MMASVFQGFLQFPVEDVWYCGLGVHIWWWKIFTSKDWIILLPPPDYNNEKPVYRRVRVERVEVDY